MIASRFTSPAVVCVLVVCAAWPALGQDPSTDPGGFWRVEGRGVDSSRYSGTVTVSRVGECWTVEWQIGGSTYSGVGIVWAGAFAVAYTNPPRFGGYGVAVYGLYDRGDGFEGYWCQPDGSRGREDLGPPGRPEGTHILRDGGSANAGTVRISSLGTRDVTPLPVHHRHALRVATLPPHHRAPLDRLLVGQAQLEKVPILTADRSFGLYDVETLPA